MYNRRIYVRAKEKLTYYYAFFDIYIKTDMRWYDFFKNNKLLYL